MINTVVEEVGEDNVVQFMIDKHGCLLKKWERKALKNMILDKVFWKDIVICLRGIKKPAMRFIYEAMDQAKDYKPILNIIDDRWDKIFHRPLHVAAYYLNPQLHYAPGPGFQMHDFKKQIWNFGTRLVKQTLDKSTLEVW
ncbi:hypothetical protein MTR_3g028350 [Medicago truncatula]|uniref:Uncharacterized protein n=1 Tax=Medicago truncatula TaxID=3880 RepID=G7IZE5_MEDTR|nr:hypothetical protein MTR_3g028350 [Medicago truncatula]